MRLFWPVLLLAACEPYQRDSTPEEGEFCSTLDDGGAQELADGSDAAAGSGSLELRVITDQSDDPRDPYYVAYRAYSLEPSQTGGVQTTGKTTGDGLVVKTLGAGTWDFEATWTRGSTTCTASMPELVLESGKTTSACAVLTCPL